MTNLTLVYTPGGYIMEKLRLRIPIIDRVGLLLDISQIFVTHNINIRAVELEYENVFFEIERPPSDVYSKVVQHIKSIPNVVDVHELDLLPHQEHSEQLKAVLSSVNDGIISVDQHGFITQYNPAAEKIIHVEAKEAIGKHLSSIFPPTIPLFTAIREGQSYTNCEIMLETTGSHYLTSGRPIIDEEGHIIGAVATMKDIKDVRTMFYLISGQTTQSFGEIVYASKSMQRVVTMAKTIAKGDSSVLIRGETGTGKELFARAIHAASSRAKKMFVPLNCAAIPDSLLETELFGYRDGAFTGASKGGRIGLFEFANHGTIFLDEIGDLPANLQAKLLRALQDGKIRRVGDTREIATDVRVIAATNAGLEGMIAKGTFREDLFYRLNVIPLFIPPLRDRHEDIPLLAGYFLKRFAIRLNKQVTAFSDTALNKLTDYHWPGNIRELENVIERAVNISESEVIIADQIVFDQDYTPSERNALPQQSYTLQEIVSKVERETLAKAVTQHNTLRQLGDALGLSHTAVLKKLRKYGLSLAKRV